MAKTITPTLGLESFSCPHCGALAHQAWYQLYLNSYPKDDKPHAMVASSFEKFNPGSIKDDDTRKLVTEFILRLKKNDVTYERSEYSKTLYSSLHNVNASVCHSCDGWALWVKDDLVYPVVTTEVTRHPEMPAELKEDFDEAASIVDRSPRGTAALLRLCIQKLMPVLKEKGDNINDDIASLVRKGLSVDVQRALDVVRVVGNNAVHPGQIDLKDNKTTALRLFELLNMVIERMISEPRKLEEVFKALPPTSLQQIEKRDTPNKIDP